MTAAALHALTGGVLFLVGLWAMFARVALVQRVVAMNVMSSGVFLVIVAIAERPPGEAPDPVPHALVLTGIVVAVSVSALALALARRLAGGGEDGA